MVFEAFIGESYTARSLAFDAQRSMNLYLEADESGAGKANRALLGTPGLALLATLPTLPIRGIWTGLADQLPGSTSTDLCFVVGGSKLYQFFSDNSYTQLGDVGDDAAHSPVQFEVNGTQILIASAGLAWVWDNVSVSQALFNNGYGTVNTSGTAVTWVSGDQFDPTIVGSGINIAGTVYAITAYTDATHITIGSSAGTQTGAAASVMAGSGTVNTSGTAVTWVSGSNFTGLQAGRKFVIGSTVYTIQSVTDATHLTLTATAGTQTGATFSSDLPVQASVIALLDTYFAALPPNSKIYYISATSDGKTWSPLDFARKEGFPDNIASVLADHEELWLFGSETTEIWRDTGAADFPFQRDPGAFVHQGIRAPFSAVSLANGVAWIGGDARGNPIAWRAEGYIPRRISTHAIEAAWGEYTTVADATAFVYVQDGHQFWVINFPAGNATWVYDATAGTWHERGWWNGTSLDRHRAATHGYVFGKHIVGDWQNGKLYQMSPDLYDDAGTPIHRIRTAPHLSNEENWSFGSRFRLAMQSGPSPTLAWSDDLGASYSAAMAASGRTIGNSVTQMSEWRRLGKFRDRIFQTTITDAMQVALFAAYLDLGTGAG